VEHDGLVATAEQVVYFGDMKLFGQHPIRGMSVLWHERERAWLVTLPGYTGGVARAETLRKFAESALAALGTDGGEADSTIFAGDHTSIQVLTGIDDDGPYMSVWAWFDARHDFIGVGESGEPLYHNEVGAECVEFELTPLNVEHLKASLRTLLHRLDTAGQAKNEPPKSANVITTFAKRVNNPSKARLDIARRPGTGQWLITLHPHLSRPATDEAILALAEATEHIIDTRSGERSVALLTEKGYRLDLVVGANGDAFYVTATVRSPGPNGTEHLLDLDARFGPIGETHLRDMLKGLR
jgi:hypothetical protein